MARLFVIVFALAASVTCQSPPSLYGLTSAQNGQVSIGRVSGGSFGSGSFTAGEPGRGGASGYGGNQPEYGSNDVPQYPFGGKVIYGSTKARNGQVAIGRVTGGSFAPGSFSVGEPGRNYGYGGSNTWDQQRSANEQYGNPSHQYVSGFSRGDGSSIAIDNISGGSYPSGAFSIGHGDDS